MIIVKSGLFLYFMTISYISQRVMAIHLWIRQAIYCAPNEWPDLFLDPLLASAGLDRLLDRAEVIVIRGPSFRSQGRTKLLEEAQTQKTEP